MTYEEKNQIEVGRDKGDRSSLHGWGGIWMENRPINGELIQSREMIDDDKKYSSPSSELKLSQREFGSDNVSCLEEKSVE